MFVCFVVLFIMAPRTGGSSNCTVVLSVFSLTAAAPEDRENIKDDSDQQKGRAHALVHEIVVRIDCVEHHLVGGHGEHHARLQDSLRKKKRIMMKTRRKKKKEKKRKEEEKKRKEKEKEEKKRKRKMLTIATATGNMMTRNMMLKAR